MALPLLSLLVSYGLFLRGGFPEPVIHDEFSNLLAGDTFARGRLTNPTHPMWKHLQTFYTLQRPSYQSKYPPGEGFILALGQVLTDEPIVGVWIATAALVLAAAWMLAGFFETRWAIAGAVVLAVHPQVTEWSRIYWGGTAAAIGGVLVLGAWVRIYRDRRWRWSDAILMGVALGILFDTRPYEGFVAVVPILVSIFRKATPSPGHPGEPSVAGRGEGDFPGAAVFDVRNHPHPNPLPGYREREPERARFLVAMFAVLGSILLWNGYYNYRVTGNPLSLPYLVYEKQYAAAPPLLVQSVRPVPNDIPVEMREYAEDVELPNFFAQRSVGGFCKSALSKTRELLGDVIGVKPGGERSKIAGCVLFFLVVMIVIAIARNRQLRMPAAVTLCVYAATMISNWSRSQYVAPATGAVLVLAVGAIRDLSRRWTWAGWLVVATVIIVFGLIAFESVAVNDQGSGRARVLASLEAEKGKQLVLVKYMANHRSDDEWVENAADIDAAAVVWARDPGPGADAQLRAYFHDRKVWRLTVARDGVRLAEDLQAAGHD